MIEDNDGTEELTESEIASIDGGLLAYVGIAIGLGSLGYAIWRANRDPAADIAM